MTIKIYSEIFARKFDNSIIQNLDSISFQCSFCYKFLTSLKYLIPTQKTIISKIKDLSTGNIPHVIGKTIASLNVVDSFFQH